MEDRNTQKKSGMVHNWISGSKMECGMYSKAESLPVVPASRFVEQWKLPVARGSVFMLGCVWGETKLYYPSIGFATKGKQEAEAAISPEAGETALMERKQSSQANRYSKKKKTTTTTKKSNRQYLYVSNSACSKEDRQELAIQSSKEILKEEDDEHAGRKEDRQELTREGGRSIRPVVHPASQNFL
ncbi:unnamed protein product [Miscanthus lutarioriparius]|uniref:Uncharacterized protein n=1 Tax=Miscanthus lutarioriparius TaxID=422564 RepID=A0A811QJ99_9POAL|nr:unnamed protein product [Miscanthus lutarioriparius]